MTDSDVFKYDVRVRDRMLRKGLIEEAEVDKRMKALNDLEGKYVELELKQPALHRHEPEAPAARLAPAVSSPSGREGSPWSLKSEPPSAAEPESQPALVKSDPQASQEVDETELEQGWGEDS